MNDDSTTNEQTDDNPFEKTMCKLYIPAHMGDSISVGGFSLRAKKDRSVTVPSTVAPELRAHGLTDSPAA